MQPPPQFEVQHVNGRHANWIDGQAVASSGGLYELWARDGSGRRLGEWPRSNACDVERALIALPIGRVCGQSLDLESARKALGPDSERTVNAAVAAVWGWPADGATWVAEGGLAPEPNRDHALRYQARLGHGEPFGTRAGTLAVFLAGSLLTPGEVFQGLARLLEAGANVIVVAAEENPLSAEWAVRAASAQLRERGTVGALPLALIHAPTTAGWQALLTRLELSLVIGNQHGGTVTEALFDLWSKAPARPEPVRRILIPARESLRVWDLELPHSRAALAATVQATVQQMFGARAMGGLANQSAGVIHVQSAIYSEVVELFRDALQHHPGLPTWPGGARIKLYEAAWRGAVDAGASLLCGGQIERTRYGPLLQPTLLVNVSMDSHWSRPGLPLAQLRLVRLNN